MQYKLGHVYKCALPPFLFDALLGVRYYLLASQQGKVEADTALSNWFLCGAEGAFDKDENLALRLPERAGERRVCNGSRCRRSKGHGCSSDMVPAGKSSRAMATRMG